MATLKIRVKNSQFVDYSGVDVKLFTSTKVKGNGWECTIDDKGNISCVAEHHYDGEKHTIKFNLKNGWVKLLLKVADEKVLVLKSYKMDNWCTDGIIGLPSGRIDNRRAYFRAAEFQEFLDQHELTAVRHESANGVFVLTETSHKGDIVFKEEIEATDGQTKVVFDYDDMIEERDGTTTSYRRVEVTHATWVIKKVVKNNGILRILYTSDNPKEILNLPKK